MLALAALGAQTLDLEALAERLQREGVEAFATSWHAMLTRIREKCMAPPVTPVP